MTTSTVRNEVLQRHGVELQEMIDHDSMPDGRRVLEADEPSGTIAGYVGLLAG